MDWLNDHLKEVIIPNLRTELFEQTGIRIEPSLGELRFVAEPLDEDLEEDCEEFEITIHLGKLCLVDACFLLEEVESGLLPFAIEEDQLRDALIQLKMNSLKRKVLPEIRTELAQELATNQWNPRFAEVLELSVEVLEEGALRIGSGGYPPIMLVVRHPHFDNEVFELSVRFDPMAREEWIDWGTFMPKLSSALKSVGEEPDEEGAMAQAESPRTLSEEEGPTAEDLEDQEISDLEEDAEEGAPEGEAELSPEEARATGNLLASLEATLGIKLTPPSSRKRGETTEEED